jgi:site-specific DNA-methyltransferase (adenine-specific)
MKTNICYQGDCLEVMKDMPDKSIDLVLTDPPYGISADSKPIRGKFTHKNLNFDTSIPSKKYFDEIIRISKNQIIWGGNYFAHFLEPKMGWIFWDKELRGFSLADGELAWTSFNKALRVFKQNRPSVRARDGKHHPTQKSVDLMIFCIEYAKKNYKKDINIILDCFAGSGTTGVACKKIGIDFILIEREKEYCDIIKERVGCEIIKNLTN